MQLLYYFVLSQEDCPLNFEIETNFPKRVLMCKPSDEPELEDYADLDVDGQLENWRPRSAHDPPSFRDMGLTNSEILFVINLDA